jgi:hypothetical protein
MISEILEYSKANKELLGITLYGESGFWCGIVEDYNEEVIQLRHYTKYGELDGVAIEKISNIERIDISDDYINAMKIVIEHKEKMKNIEIKSRIFDDLNPGNWQYISLKPFENDNNVLTSIQINNDNFYQGFVKGIDEEYLKFEIVGNEGNSEGTSLFKIENINSIKINDLECRRKLLIYKIKNAS